MGVGARWAWVKGWGILAAGEGAEASDGRLFVCAGHDILLSKEGPSENNERNNNSAAAAYLSILHKQ